MKRLLSIGVLVLTISSQAVFAQTPLESTCIDVCQHNPNCVPILVRLDALSLQLTTLQEQLRLHDEEPSWLRKFVSNRYIHLVGAALLARFALPQ